MTYGRGAVGGGRDGGDRGGRHAGDVGGAAASPATREDIARHYDSLDGLYRAIWGEHVHHGYWVTGRESAEDAVVQLVERVADAAGVRTGSRVCDVGCGYGATSRWLTAHRGCVVTGLTISPAQHAYAVQRGGNFLLRSWLENDLPDRSFDAVIAIESISHMPDRERVFAEAHRVLAPGGRLVVYDWFAPARARAWQRRWLLDPICREGRLPSLHSIDGYASLVRATGFVDLQAEDISRHVWRTWPLVVRRALGRVRSDPELRRLLLDRSHSERDFVALVLRLIAGYSTRGFRYGTLVARRPAV